MAEKNKELTKALQKAKKSPRNFAIIAKGTNVLQLIVDKKPLKSGDLKEAKKKFEGNAIVEGVVLGGNGNELVFQVQQEPSVGETKLKKFISEETGLPLKPSFAVVQKLAEVPDDDDEDESGESSSAEEATGAAKIVENETASQNVPPPAPPAPDSPAPDAAAASRLMGALNSLSGSIKQAAAANPAGKQELLALVSRFQTQLKQADLDEAQASLAAIRELVAAAVGAGGSEPVDSEANRAASQAADEAKRLMAELNGLAADIKSATATNPAAKADLVQLMTQFQAQVKSRELDAAQASLAAIREILAAESGESELNEDDEQDEAAGEELDLAGALGNYAAARAQVIAQLGRLAAAIEATGHAQAHAALLEIKAVQANLTAKPDTPAAVQELERYLETDDVVADVDGPNPYGIEVRLQETLLAAVYDLSVCLS